MSNHKYMVYERNESGQLTRTHHTIVLSGDDARADYPHCERLRGWPESSVYWGKSYGVGVGIAPMSISATVGVATAEQLDEIIERTEYAEAGVALGDAAADQDLRRAAQREIDRRMGIE